MYDTDDSGTLESDEIATMCKDVYGDNFETSRLAGNVVRMSQVLTSTLDRRGGVIDLRRFNIFCESHPALLYPAFQLQRTIQKKFMGTKFWTKLSKRRLNLGGGKYVTIKAILNTHLSPKMKIDMEAFEESIDLNAKYSTEVVETDKTKENLKDSNDESGKWQKIRNSVSKRRSEDSNKPRKFSELVVNSGTVNFRKQSRLQSTSRKIAALHYMKEGITREPQKKNIR